MKSKKVKSAGKAVKAELKSQDVDIPAGGAALVVNADATMVVVSADPDGHPARVLSGLSLWMLNHPSAAALAVAEGMRFIDRDSWKCPECGK